MKRHRWFEMKCSNYSYSYLFVVKDVIVTTDDFEVNCNEFYAFVAIHGLMMGHKRTSRKDPLS